MRHLIATSMLLLLVAGSVVPNRTHARSNPPPTPVLNCGPGLGGQLFSTGQTVEVTILTPDADFTSEIRLVDRRDRIIGSSRAAGRVVRLTVPAGTELVFGIRVNETGQFFRMGPGSRNPDGLPHAMLQCVDVDTAIVGFEDKINSDSLDYNDAAIRVSTRLTSQCGLPVQSAQLLSPTDSVALTSELDLERGEKLPTDQRKEQLSESLEALSRFVGDRNGMQEFITLKARQAGLSPDTIALGKKLVKSNNQLLHATKTGKDAEISNDQLVELDSLVKALAQSEFHKTKTASRNHVYVAPQACGGFLNVTACSPIIESARFFSSKADVTNHVLFLGYHLTPRYATTAAAFASQIDFTLVRPKSGCDSPGAFRNEVVIRQEGECWTYNTQGPEPNPEFLSYIWPYRLWPIYVVLWHRYYC